MYILVASALLLSSFFSIKQMAFKAQGPHVPVARRLGWLQVFVNRLGDAAANHCCCSLFPVLHQHLFPSCASLPPVSDRDIYQKFRTFTGMSGGGAIMWKNPLLIVLVCSSLTRRSSQLCSKTVTECMCEQCHASTNPSVYLLCRSLSVPLYFCIERLSFSTRQH